jgi:hypothetical protein
VLDLSSFKCGHDAPTYGLVDSIIGGSQTPYAALHDIDANKPGGSIKIRVRTYTHSLSLYEERLEDQARQRDQLHHALDQKRLELLQLKAKQLQARQQQDPAVTAQIAELAKKLAAYQAPRRVIEAAPDQVKGLVQLKKKAKDGALEHIGGSAAAAAPAAELDPEQGSLQRRRRRLGPADIESDFGLSRHLGGSRWLVVTTWRWAGRWTT